MRPGRTRVFVAVVIASVIAASGCAADSTTQDTPADALDVTTTAFPIEMTDEALLPVYSTWVDMLGLRQMDPAVWRSRLSEACTLGA